MTVPDVDRDSLKIDNKAHQGLGVRHLQCFMCFLAYGIAYANRICVSLAVVAIQEEQKSEDELTQGQIGIILSSFMWGYALAQIPIGYLARIWSAKMIFGICMLMGAIGSIACPIIFDKAGWMGMCACRIIMGLCQACLPPCICTLLSKWVPPSERSRLCAMTYSGSEVGSIISLPITGALIDAAGWRSPFYVFGAAAVIWSVVFILVGFDSPAAAYGRSCCGITEAERKHIESSIGVPQDETTTCDNKRSKTPWLSIFTSAPFWALLIVHCGQKWGYYMLLTEIPIYMNGVLGFNIKENGLKSALPYIALFLLTYPISCLSDWGEKKGVPRGLLRKLCNTFGLWGPALALVGISFVSPGDTTLPVVLLVLAVGLNAGAMCGFQLNHLDLTRKYAGLLASFTNSAGSVVALLAPLVVGLIVTDSTHAEQWKIVFFMTGGIYFVTNLIFILFGSGEIQWWDNSEYSGKDNNEKSVKAEGSWIVIRDDMVP